MNDSDEDRDAAIMAKAMAFKAENGGSLVDAVLWARSELYPDEAPAARKKPVLPKAYAVTIHVKPRVASWITQEFAPTASHTTEQRLGAYLSILLGQSRVRALRASEDGDIGDGMAMSRALFIQKAPQA